MRTAILAGMLLLASCMPLEQPATTQVPTDVLPSGPSDVAGAIRLLDWVEQHPLAIGDDDAPDKPCTQHGAPHCIDVHPGLDWCDNACGDAYWHLEYTNTCIDVMTGEVISCP